MNPFKDVQSYSCHEMLNCSKTIRTSLPTISNALQGRQDVSFTCLPTCPLNLHQLIHCHVALLRNSVTINSCPNMVTKFTLQSLTLEKGCFRSLTVGLNMYIQDLQLKTV